MTQLVAQSAPITDEIMKKSWWGEKEKKSPNSNIFIDVSALLKEEVSGCGRWAVRLAGEAGRGVLGHVLRFDILRRDWRHASATQEL